MTRFCSEKTSAVFLGLLALAAAGCPRTDFDFGGAGSAGSGGAKAGSPSSEQPAGSGSAGSGSDKSCGSRGLPACSDDEFCSFPRGASCGEADKPGVCTPRTKGDVVCTTEFAPVCGCDGKTYSNACAAAGANTSVRSSGECESAGGARSCGGLVGKGCPGDQYCDYPPDAICGAADATGTCTVKPRACTRIYKPVCGCDDKTYGNDCEAHSAGVSIASEGECKSSGGDGQSCGGLVGKPCPADQYCDYPPDAICGAADATGVCKVKPTNCTLEYAPVCGCDGETYGNTCAAASSGMSVASKGECEKPGGAVCGVRGTAECDAKEFCAFPLDAQCGAADQPGKCEPRPDACDDIYQPVCGCDGKTHSNTCEANGAGTAVAHDGACKAAGGTNCGGIAGLQCESKNQYCNFPVATRCGSGDQFGQCADKPTGCTKELREVCGCDGNTYGNPCMAAAAGVSIQKDGACATGGGSGDTCGGLIGAKCPSGEYCDYPQSAQCGAADQTGTCKTIPNACTLDYTPVCGCDDTTYANACGAHAKSVSVLHDGPC